MRDQRSHYDLNYFQMQINKKNYFLHNIAILNLLVLTYRVLR